MAHVLKIKGPNVPIFNDGTENYRIVTDDGIETAVAEFRFLAVSAKTPKEIINDYLEDQRRVARALLALCESNPQAVDHIVQLRRDIRKKYEPKR